MNGLQIVRINDLQTFNELRSCWESLYRSDSNSHIFISWLWLDNYFNSLPADSWFVLGVKDKATDTFVAFLPLKAGNKSMTGGNIFNHLEYAGLSLLTYSGMLCVSNHEAAVIHSLSSYIQNSLKWDTLAIPMLKDPRLIALLDLFPESKFKVRKNKDYTTLFVNLPDDYELLLASNVSRDTRRSIRRKTRYIEGDERLEIRQGTKDTIQWDIEATCELWNDRWNDPERMEWHRKGAASLLET